MKKLAGYALLVSMIASCSTPKNKKEEENKLPKFETTGSIERLDPRIDGLIPKDAKIEILAEGFTWAEGPLWVPAQDFLLFSDVPENTIYKWTEEDSISLYLFPSGYKGEEKNKHEPGSNGLALDNAGNLILCQHGNRQVARMKAPVDQPVAEFETVAGAIDGRQLNSPNDVVINSKGAYFFTDPPYGLDEWNTREVDFCGVYKVDAAGKVTVLVDSLTRPNGIALSPDEKTLYVAVSDPEKARYYAYELDDNGMVTAGRVLLDVTHLVKEGRKGSCDGLKTDDKGNLFATGPGGVLVISPEGEHLGTIMTGEATANCAFNEDKTVLFMTADMYLMRIKL